ncbi:glycosyltransferase family 2 protein [Serinicoccus marinus]|uniref:glycosyltransferase family 2 protein n=1 Tax=Serinicoccus marinus TaxID=247333 RepID=UPI0019310BF9|nr:glycosyltransferase [Serinicoccus marinus]
MAAQDYEGPIEVVVVYDRSEPDQSLSREGDRPVVVMKNARTPGLAGGRNTGIVSTAAPIVAFCDDDDQWMPTKLRRQIEALSEFPSAPMATSSIIVDYEGQSSTRSVGGPQVTHEMLVRSRMAMLHSSTFVFRRDELVGRLGLISEEIPGSQNEDWDILLRASQIHPIVHVDEPLVHVKWGRSSFFARRWDTKIDSSVWMLRNHPDVAKDRRGAARVMGQIAFAHACSGDRWGAWRWSARAARRNPVQWRWALSSVVALWPPAGEHALGLLHRVGRGV